MIIQRVVIGESIKSQVLLLLNCRRRLEVYGSESIVERKICEYNYTPWHTLDLHDKTVGKMNGVSEKKKKTDKMNYKLHERNNKLHFDYTTFERKITYSLVWNTSLKRVFCVFNPIFKIYLKLKSINNLSKREWLHRKLKMFLKVKITALLKMLRLKKLRGKVKLNFYKYCKAQMTKYQLFYINKWIPQLTALFTVFYLTQLALRMKNGNL